MTTTDAIRSTVADVDLDAITANVEAIRARAKADVIAVVKADAYGHGAEAVAETCFEAGAVMVAVATIEEGLALREGGINGPILVLLGPTDSSEVGHAVALDLVLVTWDIARARAISEAATALRRDAHVHFKVDTGLTRLGAPVNEAATRYRAIASLPHLEIDGIGTVAGGYGEGLARGAGESGAVRVRAHRVPFAGRICMDLVTLDVTAIEGAREGDEVVLIGAQAGANQTAEDLAEVCGTINYEIVTGIRRRVPRRYFRGGQVVATRTLAEGYHAR